MTILDRLMKLGKCAFLQTGDDLRALPACLFLLFFLQGQVQKPKHNRFCAAWHYLYCRAKPSIIFLIYGLIKKCPPPYTGQFITVREAVAVQPSMIFMVNKNSLIVYPLGSGIRLRLIELYNYN